MFSLTIKRKDLEKALTLSNKIHAPSSSASRSNTRGIVLVVAPVPETDECDVRLICSDVTHARALAVVVPEDVVVSRAPVDMVILDMNTTSLIRAIGKRSDMVSLRYEDDILKCDDTGCQVDFYFTEINKVLAVPTEVVAWASVDANEVRRGILDMIREGNALNAAVVNMSVDGGITIRIRSSIAWNVVSIGGGVDYPFYGSEKGQNIIAVGPLAALATLIDYGVEKQVEISLMGEPVRFLRLRYGNVTVFASFKKGLG